MFENADQIYRYTRADAIRDGVLIDVTSTAKGGGLQVPRGPDCGRLGAVRQHPARCRVPGRSRPAVGRADHAPLCDPGAGRQRRARCSFAVHVRNDNEEPHASAGATQGSASAAPATKARPVITVMMPDED